MKFGIVHILVVGILIGFVALWMMRRREHLDAGCPSNGAGIKSVTQSGGFNVRLYTKGECSAMGGSFAGNGKTTWGMTTNAVGECTGTPGGANASFCNVDAPPSAEAAAATSGCPTEGEGIKSINQSGGFNVRLYTKGECSTMGGNFAGNGQSTWGMPNNDVGECLGTPGGANASFCNVDAPPSAAATAATAAPVPAAASATPGCPTKGEGIKSINQSGGFNVRLYTNDECSGMGGNFAGNGQTTWGMANNDVGECTGTPGGANASFCNVEAPPSASASAAVSGSGPAPVASATAGCPTSGEGITSIKQTGGLNVRLYTKGECTSLGGNFAGNGQSTWGMANNDVGECLGTPGGTNISFCNQTAPPSAAANSVANPAAVPSGPPPPPPTNERIRPSWAPQGPPPPAPSNQPWAPPGNPAPPVIPTNLGRVGAPAPPGSMSYAPYTLSSTATSPLGPGPEYVSKNELVPCQCMKPTCNKEHFTD
jgi:hypothetical protein